MTEESSYSICQASTSWSWRSLASRRRLTWQRPWRFENLTFLFGTNAVATGGWQPTFHAHLSVNEETFSFGHGQGSCSIFSTQLIAVRAVRMDKLMDCLSLLAADVLLESLAWP